MPGGPEALVLAPIKGPSSIAPLPEFAAFTRLSHDTVEADQLGETGLSSYRWITLLLATSVQIGVSILQQAPAALGPVLSRALDLSHAQIGLLSSAIWAGMLVTMLPMGVMIDRRGEKMVILVGVAMMIAMVGAATQVATFLWLFLFLLVASFGASSSAPGGAKAIAAWFPKSQRGSAMGIRQTGVAVGGLVAALVLPPVAVRFGWAVALQLAIIVTIMTLICFAFLYRELPADQKDQVTKAKPSPSVKLGSILKDRSFLAATAYAFVFMGVQGSSASFLALHLHEELHLSIVAAGAFLAVFQVGGMAGRLGWGVMSDRVGRRAPIMVLVGAISAASCVAIALAGSGLGMAAVAVLALLIGCSAMGWNGLYLTALAESTPLRNAGTTIGASLTVSFLGMFLVPPLFGLLGDVTGTLRTSWLALAGWAILGTLLGLLIREPRVHRS